LPFEYEGVIPQPAWSTVYSVAALHFESSNEADYQLVGSVVFYIMHLSRFEDEQPAEMEASVGPKLVVKHFQALLETVPSLIETLNAPSPSYGLPELIYSYPLDVA
jgi:hypothetical protein